MGARVLGVASGDDGVDLVRRLGADSTVDKRRGDVRATIRAFAPDGADALLILSSGDSLDQALSAVKQGGRVGYPDGVEPEPYSPPGIEVTAYDGTPTPEVFERLN